MATTKPKNVDNYIAQHPAAVQTILQNIRQIVKSLAPNATESIAYGMPGYKINNKPLVYFAAYPHHIGFYATPAAHAEFAEQLAKYKQGKGSVQFPLNKPIPYGLIQKLTAFKLAQLTNNWPKPVKDSNINPNTATGRINFTAISLLRQNPAGLRWTDLAKKIQQSNPEFHPKTVNGCIWLLAERFPNTVYKPSRGIFKLVEFKSKS